jgi:hypothetical protein
MTKVTVEIHDNVIDLFNKIKNIEDMGIEINIPKGSVLLDSVITIKLLKKMAQREGKVLNILTDDPQGKVLLETAEEGSTVPTIPYEEYTSKTSLLEKAKNFSLNNPFKNINFNLNKGSLYLIPVLILGGLVIGGFILIGKTYKASAKVIVEAQPLTRSLSIKVKKDTNSDYTKNILKGTLVQDTLQNSASAPTTGKKLIGEKSKGEITIYNKTDAIKEFKKGTILIYEDDDTEYQFQITKNLDVPARIDAEDPEATVPTVYGENTASVEAMDIGKEYNLDKGKKLTFDDYKSSEFEAKTKDKTTGGTKEEKKAVDAKDLETLKKDLTTSNTEKIQSLLNKNRDNNTKYIKGSESIQIIKEEYSAKVGDEKDTITLDQTITAEALSYSNSDLDNLLGETLKTLIPEGYEISKQEKDIKVEVLGNSTNSVLSKDQADLQVTVKINIVPKIDVEELKNKIKGVSLEEAQKVLGSIASIKTYELNIFPNLPFLRYIPKNDQNITVLVEKE